MIDIKTHISKIKLFKITSEIAEELDKKVYIVGGFVRDLYLERERSDIDFLVVGNGLKFASRLAEKLKVKNVQTFKNFGTAHFIYNDFDLEFVGARKESYDRDSRKPIVQDGTFDDDINRRDFTINSIAVSLNKNSFGEVIDKFNGLKDIENKIIKTPLDPLITFDDDPLRIMRAFRFAAQLNFEVEGMLMIAAEKMADRLNIVSQERITEEFLKILETPTPSIGLKLLYNSGVMKVVFPEISMLGGVEQINEHHHKDVFLHTCKVVDNISADTNNVWLRFAALVHDIAKPQTKKYVEGTGWTFHAHDEIGARMMKKIFKRMKLPFNKLEYVKKLVRLHLRPIALVNDGVTDSAIRRLVVAAGEDLDDLITLCRADITSKNPAKVNKYLNNYEKVVKKIKEVEEKDRLRAFQSPVRGEEIMKICGIPPSKTVGDIKSAIEEAILEGEIANDYDEALEFLLKIKDGYLKQ
ncbi:MAG: HD domain-containing protein [Ignavibacteriae bacterium]|nr:HD domain-containing protein [Ignavibacteriota bacterium]NOG98271.1 HD domain-containing protein [Ignavibacteriota bacterium]